MDRTNANDFRSNMKDWLEAARKEPIRITRKSGESFVLLDADTFEKMQLDLVRLQGLTASLVDSIQGRVNHATDESTRDALNRAKARVVNSSRNKKAVG